MTASTRETAPHWRIPPYYEFVTQTLQPMLDCVNDPTDVDQVAPVDNTGRPIQADRRLLERHKSAA